MLDARTFLKSAIAPAPAFLFRQPMLSARLRSCVPDSQFRIGGAGPPLCRPEKQGLSTRPSVHLERECLFSIGEGHRKARKRALFSYRAELVWFAIMVCGGWPGLLPPSLLPSPCNIQGTRARFANSAVGTRATPLESAWETDLLQQTSQPPPPPQSASFCIIRQSGE